MTIPCQTVIKENGEVIPGTMDTTAKFNLMTKGIDLKGKLFLDAGCNAGMMCQLASQAGAIPKGIDINFDTIKEARLTFPNLQFQCENAETLSDNYDIILASAMLHYVDLDKTLKQFSRCAKQVICDVWLHPSEVPIFALTTRGIYIPSYSAFIDIAGKYFGIIEKVGSSLSPDDSERFIFHLSNPRPNPPEAILIYGPPESGKSVLSRTYFNHLILRTDDIFFVWKDRHMNLDLSIQFSSDMLRGKELSRYIDFCTQQISDWLDSRINRDIVIEGYDLSFTDYRSNIINLLQSKGWKVTEVKI